MFEIKKGTKQGDPQSSLLFNTVLQNSLKDITQRWQKKKGMGIYLSDHDHNCLTKLRFADDVLLFATSKEQLQKMLCDFKESTEKVGLRIHPEKTKILSNQSTLCSDTKKELQIDDIKIEILTRSESVKYVGQMITFQQQDTTEIKNRIRAAWATFHKNRQELTSKNCFLKHRVPLFVAVLTPTTCYASGTWAPTKEHERMIQSAQSKVFRLIIQTTRRYKKIVKHKVKTSEDLNNIDSSCTDDESEDGKGYVSHEDQDSDVSSESDNDEEIDAAEIEEEDWVDYIKRSTNEAMEKMENEKIRCWNVTQKNEMEIVGENRHITEREMVDKCC